MQNKKIKQIFDNVNKIEPFKGMKSFIFDVGNLILKLEEQNVTGDILEIGTRRGKTSIFLALLLQSINSRKRVFTIDPFHETEEDHYKKFLKNCKHWNLPNYIHWKLTSADALKKLGTKKFSFIFIDGDHSFDGVLFDVGAYVSFLNPRGGIMAVDDVNNGKYPGVCKAVNILKEKGVIEVIRYSKGGRALFIRRSKKLQAKITSPIAAPVITICEKHRELADLIKFADLDFELKENMLNIVAEAFDMAKRMNRKLRQYKHNYDEGMWQPNNDLEVDFKKRIETLKEL